MAVSAEDFKASLGCRATGVSIVTSRDGDRIHGMTVSDFASVSLEPPLVLVSASKTTRTLELILGEALDHCSADHGRSFLRDRIQEVVV